MILTEPTTFTDSFFLCISNKRVKTTLKGAPPKKKKKSEKATNYHQTTFLSWDFFREFFVFTSTLNWEKNTRKKIPV